MLSFSYGYVRYADKELAMAELIRLHDPVEPHKLNEEHEFHVNSCLDRTLELSKIKLL